MNEAYHGQDRRSFVCVNRWRSARDGRELVEATIRITSRCNQRCAFCQVSGQRLFLTDAKITEAIRSLAAGPDPVWLNLSGGEPTLNPKLFQYVTLSIELPFERVFIQTNAVRFSDRLLAGRLPRSGRLRFFVSFHGFTREAYDVETGTRGHFEKAVCGVNNLLEAGFKVMLNVVFTSRNLPGLPPMVRQVPSLFPRYRRGLSLNFSTMGPFGDMREKADLIPRMSEVLKGTRRTLRVARAIGLQCHDFAATGFCSLPACILPARMRASMRDLNANFRENVSESGVAYGLRNLGASTLVKAETCRKCSYDPYCPGVTREYGLRYGLGELRPVRSGVPAFITPKDT